MSDTDYVRTLVKMLKSRGYSDEVVKEVIRWYCD